MQENEYGAKINAKYKDFLKLPTQSHKQHHVNVKKLKDVEFIKSGIKKLDQDGNISRLDIKIYIKSNGVRLKNVLVSEIIPAIGKPSFDKKPSNIVKSHKGTRIGWNLKILEKGEDNEVSYSIDINPAMGKVVLPYAVVRYKKGKKLFEFLSNGVVFSGRNL